MGRLGSKENVLAMQRRSILGILFCLAMVQGDLYLHNPRGSNNRLNENTATRTNANRLFNSENNNRGGYNVGDKTENAAGGDQTKQYSMKYFQSGTSVNRLTGEGASQLTFEWTNQHGCGGNEDRDPQKQNCNLVLQYMCENVDEVNQLKESLRDGTNTGTGDFTPPGSLDEAENVKNGRRTSNLQENKGMHESWDWYNACYIRERNAGLFIADRNLKKNTGKYSSAIHTRQNNNGDRYGYECPEEHDYYPYWHPSPWKDIAVLAENASMCSHYQRGSFNVQPYHECVEKYESGNRKPGSRWNNRDDCEANGGTWALLHNYLEKLTAIVNEQQCKAAGADFLWEVPFDAKDITKKECLVPLSQPDCYEAPWSRSNHLGNGRGNEEPLHYTWTLPHFQSQSEQRCVTRMRYNITTDDYDPYNTNSSFNKEKSPVQNDPKVDVGGPVELQIALNTNQVGRVFQDRSHVFYLKPRPQGTETERIFNLNVRGKRGNIVQAYPAVEYDFFPNNLEMTDTDLVHIQWTGSNTHNNGGNGGDGQAGDDGEGKAGSDRNNMAEISDLNENFPLPYEQTTMWKNAEIKWIYHGDTNLSPKQLALDVSSVGYYRCFTVKECPGTKHQDYIVETKQQMQNQLDNTPASYEGVLLRFKKGTYHYMCTRNNNFTNRSQKGSITVSIEESKNCIYFASVLKQALCKSYSAEQTGNTWSRTFKTATSGVTQTPTG